MKRSTAFFETRLAATIRDYMRARQASDQIAVKFGAESICHLLGCLLDARLEEADDWDSRERWIDGMVGAEVEVAAPDRIRVAGHMIWGMQADVGGAQWAEPFEADVTIGWKTYDLKQYLLRFSDRRELDAKRVTTGSYGSLAGTDGAIVFRPAFGESGDREGFPYQPEHAPASWLYEFRKGDCASTPPASPQ